MNPAEVAQSALPLTSSDLSLFALFWQAHWLVKSVMVGLLLASVWVWAIVIDKIMLYARTESDGPLRAGVLVRPVAGGALPPLSTRPAHSMAALFVAAMREWKRSFERADPLVRRASRRASRR